MTLSVKKTQFPAEQALLGKRQRIQISEIRNIVNRLIFKVICCMLQIKFVLIASRIFYKQTANSNQDGAECCSSFFESSSPSSDYPSFFKSSCPDGQRFQLDTDAPFEIDLSMKIADAGGVSDSGKGKENAPKVAVS